jgi:hypothetical protein
MQNIPFNKTGGNVDVLERLRVLNKKQRHAVLATDAAGKPYTSLVAFALTADARGALFATPRKTSKYKNILKNRNVSLLIDTRSNSARAYMKSEAVTILGAAVPVRRGKRWNDLSEILIKKHPQLTGFVRSPSSALIFVAVNKVIHAGKFQTVTEWTNEKNIRGQRSS